MSASLPCSVFETSLRVVSLVTKELTSSKFESKVKLSLTGVDVIGCDVHDELASVTSNEFDDVMQDDLGKLLTGILSNFFKFSNRKY